MAITDIDPNAFSLAEVKQMEQDLAKAIGRFEDPRKIEARAKLDELGYSFEDLSDAASFPKRAASAPKHRRPENPEITWPGRGRKPAWIAEALATGKSLEGFAI